MISEQSRSGVQILSIDISAKMKTITKVPISGKFYVSVSIKDSKTCPRKEHFMVFVGQQKLTCSIWVMLEMIDFTQILSYLQVGVCVECM